MRQLALLLPLLAACGGDVPTAPPSLPFGAIGFTPPAFYQTWWRLTEACSGRSGNFATVSWYVVPGNLFELDGQLVSGYSVALFNRIVLAGDVVSDGPSVRHEMLHQLLGAGVDGHPRSEFLGGCGGTVYCSSSCIKDGGPAPAAVPGAIRLSPGDLDIFVEVTPPNPSLANENGRLSMTVLAANRTGQPAEVALPGNDGIGFSFSLTSDKGYLRRVDVAATQPETTRFAAGEVKRYVFDFRIDENEFASIPHGPELSAGIYTFAGAYGGTWAPKPPTVTLIR
jgi:hypothetical protein